MTMERVIVVAVTHDVCVCVCLRKSIIYVPKFFVIHLEYFQANLLVVV